MGSVAEKVVAASIEEEDHTRSQTAMEPSLADLSREEAIDPPPAASHPVPAVHHHHQTPPAYILSVARTSDHPAQTHKDRSPGPQYADESALSENALIGSAGIDDRTRPNRYPIELVRQLAVRARARAECGCTEGEKAPSRMEDGKGMALGWARAGVRWGRTLR
jgi:hypothetical protein